MKKHFFRGLSVVLCIMLLVTSASLSAFAAVDFTDSTEGYYNVISKKDFVVSPGVQESEIVLDNDAGSRRQVLHVMEADPKNENVGILPHYSNMENPNDESKYKVITTSKHAEQAVADGYNVVGAMNTALSWDTNQPLGKFVVDGVVWRGDDNTVGCQTYLAVKQDGTADLRAISEPLEADDYEAIGLNFGFMVKDGKNVAGSVDHSGGDPRSVIGVKADGTIVMMMCDGRMSPYAFGLSSYEIADVMISLGCVEACNGDGGGSSSYLSKREGENALTKRSRNSDGIERETSMALLIVNTAPDSDVFDHASMTPENDYITPGSEVTINTIGVSSAGTAAEIPAEISWQMADSSFGSVENGVFTSNGTLGDAVVQMIYGGNVVGETTVHVAIPDRMEFEQDQMTIPFGKRAPLTMHAYSGNAEVALKGSDVNFVFSEPSIGTLDGFMFTAVSEDDAAATASDVTATLTFNNEVTAAASITLGKGSEVVFDFEGENDLDDWGYYNYNVKLPKGDKAANELISIADSNTGKVRNGEHSLAVTVDLTDAAQGGWIQYRLYYEGEYFEREGAIKFGFWAWIPEEAVADEIDVRPVQMKADRSYVGSAKEVNNPDYAVNEQDEAGWHYFTYTLTQPYVYFGKTETLAQTLLFQFYNYKQMWQNDSAMNIKNDQGKFTYYIDDITLEYSSAADDTAPPIFSNLSYAGSTDTASLNNGATLTDSENSFMVNVAEDTTLSTAVGLNADSVKAYIDGNVVPSTFNNGAVSTNQIALNDGYHTVKFYAEDNNGNPASIVRSFTVNAASALPTVTVKPHDPSLTNLPFDSLYWLDVVASDIASVDSVSVDIDLNNATKWELDHMVVADGFTASYKVLDYDQIAEITITRTADTDATGEAALVSLPTRIWSPSSDDALSVLNTEPKRIWFIAKTKKCLLTTTDGAEIPCGTATIETPTERYLGKFDKPSYDGTVHTHTVTALPDVDATCTEDGYTGRTFCEDCNSVVAWGTTIPATGHSYVREGDQFVCETCGEPYKSGTGLFEMDGVNYYSINNKLISGWQMIDDEWYCFDKTTYAGVDGTVSNHDVMNSSNTFTYTFDNGKLLHGEWVETTYGTRYYYGPNYYFDEFVTIDGNDYYFYAKGNRAEGVSVIKYNAYSHNPVNTWVRFTEDGKFIEKINGLIEYEGNLYYMEEGVPTYMGLIKVDDDYYYIRSNGIAATDGDYYAYVTNCDLPAEQTYQFGPDGKMIVPEPDPVKNGIVDGYYYENDEIVYKGLTKIGDDYYYIRSTGLVATNGTYYAYKTSCDLPAEREYKFDENGKMIDPPTPHEGVKNGIVDGYYYEDDQIVYKGLTKIGDDYYYIRSTGIVATNGTYYAYKTSCDLPAEREYKFDVDGKMIDPPTPYEGVKNGIVDGYYYENDQIVYKGLTKIGDDYYYIRTTGIVAKNGKFYAYKTSCDLPDDTTYTFDAEGKMVR